MSSEDTHKVCGSMSVHTGVAPTYLIAWAPATKLRAGMITSSPSPISSKTSARCSADVQLLVPTTYTPFPIKLAKASSNFFVRGPNPDQPDRRTSATASSSSIPYLGFRTGITIVPQNYLEFRKSTHNLHPQIGEVPRCTPFFEIHVMSIAGITAQTRGWAKSNG